jgi:hypothetical protein
MAATLLVSMYKPITMGMSVITNDLEYMMYKDFSDLFVNYTAAEILRNFIIDVLNIIDYTIPLIQFIRDMFFRVICIVEYGSDFNYKLIVYSRVKFIEEVYTLLNSDELNFTTSTIHPKQRVANTLLNKIIMTI